MACLTTIEYITAYSIWEDLSSPTTLSVSTISGRLVSPINLGGLNTKLSQGFTIVSGSYFDNALAADPAAIYIYTQLYKYNYYNVKFNQIGSSNRINWTSLAEGDTKIGRTDPVNMAKFYSNAAKDALAEVNSMANKYRMNLSTAKSVDYYGMTDGFSNWSYNYLPLAGYRL